MYMGVKGERGGSERGYEMTPGSDGRRCGSEERMGVTYYVGRRGPVHRHCCTLNEDHHRWKETEETKEEGYGGGTHCGSDDETIRKSTLKR